MGSFNILQKQGLLGRVVLLPLLILSTFLDSSGDPTTALTWRSWSDSIFDEAAKSHKLVLLDLEAIWCHWCHVMDKETYTDPAVRKILSSSYIPVKVDQDAMPELGVRYRDFGWPATIVFNSSGKEIRIMSGFVSPKDFSEILAGAVKDPTPKDVSSVGDEQVSGASSLAADIREELTARFRRSLDLDLGGLKTSHRYLDPDTTEYALNSAWRNDDPSVRDWVFKTLNNNEKLIDQVWGGVYQYSTYGDWDHPHYEKIVPPQSSNLFLYAMGWKISGDDRYLKDLTLISNYLFNFLMDKGGAFYTSQDADVVQGEHSTEYFNLGDSERRQKGMPAVDQHIYSRENGLLIEALAFAASLTGKRDLLDHAANAANWIKKNRKTKEGGFGHGSADSSDLSLGDSLSMGRAFLALYAASADRVWLSDAIEIAKFIGENFTFKEDPGLYSGPFRPNSRIKPVRRLDENIAGARFANMLWRYTGDDQYKKIAERASSYVFSKEAAYSSISEPGVLLVADEEAEPPHITVVGSKKDSVAAELWSQANQLPLRYKRVEWWDRAEGDLPNPDVGYPNLPKPAAFLCANKRCSIPLFSRQELTDRMKALQQVKK